jgi:hypothetical protein
MVESAAPPPAPAPGAAPSRPFPPFDAWRIEHDPSSSGTLTREGDELAWRFSLGGGARAGQYVACVAPIDSDAGHAGVAVDLRSTRPMRVWIQVRLAGAQGGQRWGRSVYVEDRPRRVSLALEDLEPLDRATSLRPVSARIESVLFVVDMLNHPPGEEGEVRLSNPVLEMGPGGGAP